MQQMLKLAQWLFWRMRTMLWGGNASPGNRPSRSREDLVLGTLGDLPCEYCCHLNIGTLLFSPEELHCLGIEVACVSC